MYSISLYIYIYIGDAMADMKNNDELSDQELNDLAHYYDT